MILYSVYPEVVHTSYTKIKQNGLWYWKIILFCAVHEKWLTEINWLLSICNKLECLFCNFHLIRKRVQGPILNLIKVFVIFNCGIMVRFSSWKPLLIIRTKDTLPPPPTSVRRRNHSSTKCLSQTFLVPPWFSLIFIKCKPSGQPQCPIPLPCRHNQHITIYCLSWFR